MKMKTIFKIVVLNLLLFFPYVVKAETTPLNKIVAIVNSDVITRGDLDKRMGLIKRQTGDSDLSILRQKALDNLIDTLLQLQLAKKNGIQASSAEIDMIIAGIAKDHKLTLEKLKEIIPEQEGISFAEFRRQLREQVLINRTQQYFLGREISISNKDVETILRNPPKTKNISPQYHVTDIIFEIPDNTSQNHIDIITATVRKIAVELQQKDNIEEVIEKNQSNFKEQGIKNEDLGWRKINELPELFTKEITSMKVNQVIGPIKAPNGLHLLKLLAIQSPSPEKLTKTQVENIALHRKLSEKLGPWLKEIREKAYIKIIPSF